MSTLFVWFAVSCLLGIVTSLFSLKIGVGFFVLFVVFLQLIKKQTWKMTTIMILVFIIYLFNGKIHDWMYGTTFTGKEQQFFIHIESGFQVNGNVMQGQITLPRKKEKLMLKYKLRTEQEKQFFNKNFSYPTRCLVKGKLQLPAVARNLHAFDYRNYLYQSHIHWLLLVDTFDLKQCQPLKYTPFSYFSKVREQGISYIEQHFPTTVAPLAVALIFGERSLLDDNLLENYRRLGIIHLLAISGLHVGIVSGMIYLIAVRLGVTKQMTILLLLFFLPIYALLTGAAPSVLRAVLMICFILGSQLVKRVRLAPIDGLCIAFLSILIFKPFHLFQPGFQLSFFISFVLIVCAPYIFSRYESRFSQLFVVSLTAQIASLPILLYHFYEFSLISPIMNIVYVPIFSLIVLPLSFISFFVHLLIPPLATPCLFLLSKIIFSINKVAHLFAELPLSTIVLGRPNFLLMIGYVCSIGLFFYLWEKSTQMKHAMNALLIPITIMVVHSLVYQFSPFGEVTFIDVGQGDSIFIQLPFNQGNYLIDTGGVIQFESESWHKRDKNFDPGRDIVIPFLKSKGITRIDKLILTHGDMDHIGGSFHLLEQMNIVEILLPLAKERSLIEEKLIEKAATNNIPVRIARNGNKWRNGEALFHVISPLDETMERNDGSIVIYSKLGGLTWLFTGDLEENGEDRLINTFPNMHVDVLKVGHHGSKSSSSSRFLTHINARYAIISAGVSNRYGHPHEEVVTRLRENNIKIYRTDNHGAITYTFLYGKDGTFFHLLP